MVASVFQTAVIQQTSKDAPATSRLPLTVTTKKPIPHLPSPHHVLVRVHAVGLNPTDWKMITHFFMEGNTPGCDFAGVVDSVGAEAAESFPPGTRVCGADFPYRPNNKANGAFQQWCLADSRQLLKLPGKWSDVNGAALGAIGWGTVCMALSDDGALALKGTPKSPDDSGAPVLVYGGATATGLMAIQMLKL
jgi:NADPH:quinone reductase-like Zn-dependent oxidoreductase